VTAKEAFVMAKEAIGGSNGTIGQTNEAPVARAEGIGDNDEAQSLSEKAFERPFPTSQQSLRVSRQGE